MLHEACGLLWQRRQDFELVATGDPVGQVDEFTRFVGWLSQEELPRHLRAADMLIMPTIAQEALDRTAVEAMAAGRPVIASRLGGLPFTVIDRQTGLLCEPGNPADLAEKIEMLLDDPELRERLGLQGRLRFVRHYSWERIIEDHYLPLLKPRVRGQKSGVRELPARVASSVITDPCPLIPVRCRLSLIVSVLDSHEVVRRQLLHLNRVLTPECELIVVDDGSKPFLQQVDAKVILETGTNKGMFIYFVSLVTRGVTIHIFDTDPRSALAVELINRAQQNVAAVFREGDTRQTLKELNVSPQFAWIDGGHEADTPLNDLMQCFRLRIPYVAVDDTAYPSVSGAVQYMLENTPYKALGNPFALHDRRKALLLHLGDGER